MVALEKHRRKGTCFMLIVQILKKIGKISDDIANGFLQPELTKKRSQGDHQVRLNLKTCFSVFLSIKKTIHLVLDSYQQSKELVIPLY